MIENDEKSWKLMKKWQKIDENSQNLKKLKEIENRDRTEIGLTKNWQKWPKMRPTEKWPKKAQKWLKLDIVYIKSL